MWFHEEISKMLQNEEVKNLFVEQVKEQSTDLQNKTRTNNTLKNKIKRLEDEQNQLRDRFNLNQVDVATKKNNLNALSDDLKKQKQLNFDLAECLEAYNEEIEAKQQNLEQMHNLVSKSANELEPMKEKLSFKWDVVECLQKKLTETRLSSAEKESIANDLRRREQELISDLKSLKSINPANVRQLQEELLDFKIRDADVILEFDKLKRALAILKEDVKMKKLETELEMENSATAADFFSIKFNLRNTYNDQIKSEEEKCVAETLELQNELEKLKNKVVQKEKARKDIIESIYFNEEQKVQLREVQTSICLRTRNTKEKLLKAVEKRIKAEERFNNDLLQIQNSTSWKDAQIVRLAQQVKDVHLQNENFVKFNDQSAVLANENEMKLLEEEIDALEKRIRNIKSSIEEIEVLAHSTHF